MEAKKAEPTTVLAYKGFDKDLKCRGFQYAVGETYTHEGEVSACNSGFHACENPLDVWSYYGPAESRFCLVELSGELSRHEEDSKIAAGKITVKAELSLPQIITDAVRFIMDLCKGGGEAVQTASGDYSQLAASGDYSQLAASGYFSQLAASGNSSKLAASGNYSQLAASGDSSKLAASGNYSQLAASGDSSIAMAAARDCTAKSGALGCIVLTRWVEREKRYRVSVGYVGENIKADVAYTLSADGEFVEVSE